MISFGNLFLKRCQNNQETKSKIIDTLKLCCVWEDFVNVNPKQELIFFATMNEIASEMEAAKKAS